MEMRRQGFTPGMQNGQTLWRKHVVYMRSVPLMRGHLTFQIVLKLEPDEFSEFRALERTELPIVNTWARCTLESSKDDKAAQAPRMVF